VVCKPQLPDETGEICFDSIDNNDNGLVDEECEFDEDILNLDEEQSTSFGLSSGSIRIQSSSDKKGGMQYNSVCSPLLGGKLLSPFT
jgi:hypothetical protein